MSEMSLGAAKFLTMSISAFSSSICSIASLCAVLIAVNSSFTPRAFSTSVLNSDFISSVASDAPTALTRSADTPRPMYAIESSPDSSMSHPVNGASVSFSDASPVHQSKNMDSEQRSSVTSQISFSSPASISSSSALIRAIRPARTAMSSAGSCSMSSALTRSASAPFQLSGMRSSLPRALARALMCALALAGSFARPNAWIAFFRSLTVLIGNDPSGIAAPDSDAASRSASVNSRFSTSASVDFSGSFSSSAASASLDVAVGV